MDTDSNHHTLRIEMVSSGGIWNTIRVEWKPGLGASPYKCGIRWQLLRHPKMCWFIKQQRRTAKLPNGISTTIFSDLLWNEALFQYDKKCMQFQMYYRQVLVFLQHQWWWPSLVDCINRDSKNAGLSLCIIDCLLGYHCACVTYLRME